MDSYIIKSIAYEELETCAALIRESFRTVAREFNFTIQTCPTNGAFITKERLISDWNKKKKMFGLYSNNNLIGFMQLEQKSLTTYELEKLAVLPAYRHKGYGAILLKFAFQKTAALGAHKITIGMIEENTKLKKWYHYHGFIHTGTKKFAHLPFTVGFMEINL